MRAEEPCIIGGEYPDNRFSTQQGKTEQRSEGGNSQPSKQHEKRTTLSFVYFLFISKVKPSAS